MVLTNWKEVFQQERKPYWLLIPNTSRHTKIRHTLSEPPSLAPSLQDLETSLLLSLSPVMLSRAGSVVLERQRLGRLTGALRKLQGQGTTRFHSE